MSKNINLQFLKRLQGKDGVTEISDLKRNLGWIDEYENLVNSDKDLFFISFVPNEKREEAKEKAGQSPRTRNSYVKAISYVRADFDIRRLIYQKEKRVITEEELLKYKDKILEWLKKHSDLATYNAVIHSWNWIHVYWIWQPAEIREDDYSFIVSEIYDRIKREIFPNDPHLRPDYSCSNIARLLRLPGSYNHKSDYGLPPHEVEILEYSEKDSPLIDYVKNYVFVPTSPIKDYRRYLDMKEPLYALSRKLWRKWLIKNWDDTYERINHEINIAYLVCEYTGRKLAENWTNFISKRDWYYTWAFVDTVSNVVVHMGTPWLSDKYKVYSPFAFIMVHYCDNDPKKTFDYIRRFYPETKGKKTRILHNKKLVKNGKRKW